MKKIFRKMLVARVVSAFILLPGFLGGSIIVEAAENSLVCNDVIFELGMVAGWVTNMATPSESGADRWVRNENLRPLGGYQRKKGLSGNYYDELFSSNDGSWGSNYDYGNWDDWSDWGNSCNWCDSAGRARWPRWCRKTCGNGAENTKKPTQSLLGQEAPDTDYLSVTKAAEIIDDRYRRIFTPQRSGYCSYRRDGASFYIRDANITCTLGRDPSSNILQMNCK